MSTKEKIIERIKKLPDSVTFDEILDHIILIEKIERGIQQSDNNMVVDEDDLDKKLYKWLS